MLTPEELRDLPEDVAEIFEECEDVILRLIAERINAVGYINTVSVWQLIKRKESLLLRKDVAKELARYTGRSEKEIRKIFKKAGAASLLHDDSFLKANTLNKKRKRLRPLDRILKKAYDQTKGTFRNWTGTTASNVSNRFVRAMDKAALQVQSGAFSYDEAIRLATRDLADHMDYVQYPSGHRDTLEVASRRAVRTGVNQMSSKLTLQRCKELGIDFVETTAHSGARVSKSLDCRNHSWWQGKVFHLSKEGAKGEDGKFYPGFYSFEHAGYGYGEGICGWNCRHSFHPFIPGISEQVYTPEQLDKLNEKKFTYEGKQYSRYEADQYQRGLERNIRKYKRRAVLSEGVGDQKETERNQSYIRKWSNELERFTRATGLKRDYERERETVGQVVNESPQNDTDTVESVAEIHKNVAKNDTIIAGAQQGQNPNNTESDIFFTNESPVLHQKLKSINDYGFINSSTREQFDRYKTVLGDLFPYESVEEFQKMKDEDQSLWEEIQQKYRIVNQYQNETDDPMDPKDIYRLHQEAYRTKRDDFSSDYKKNGNIGVIDIDGTVLFAHSSARYESDKAYINFKGDKESLVLVKDDPHFTTLLVNKQNVVDGDGAWDRNVDSEAKLLERAHELICSGIEIKEINLLSEKTCCPSCKGVIEQFKKEHPDVILRVVSTKEGRNKKAKSIETKEAKGRVDAWTK